MTVSGCEYYKPHYGDSLRSGKKLQRPDPCDCQSCTDSTKSIKISRDHVVGKYCRLWQQCYVCSEIKFYTKLLRHYGGTCSNNTKCPVCNWMMHENEIHNARFCASERHRKNTIKRLYFLLLGIKPKRFHVF